MLTWQTKINLLIIVPLLEMESVMTFAEHDIYTIDIQDNILAVDIHGIFDVTVMQKYQQDMKRVTDELKGRPWGLLSTYHGKGLFTPEAEIALIDITHYRVKNEMLANATVFLDSSNVDLQQMQLRRVYQACHVIFHVFSDINNARAWLSGFLAEQRAVM